MLTTLSKSFDPGDYGHLGDEISRVWHARNMFDGLYNWDHEHRLWEYSICLAAAGDRSALAGKRCLDVGGGYSVLAGLLVWHGAHVTEAEVSDHRGQQEEMARRGASSTWGATPGGSFRFVQEDFTLGLPGETFDLVTCVSVIEHTGDDEAFFRALTSAVAPGGRLVLTTDFHPSGERRTTAHSRCYNGQALERLTALAPGFVSDGGLDYADRGGHVFGYNFASLVLRRAA